MWSRDGTYDEGPDAPVDEIRAAHFGERQSGGVGGRTRRRYQFRPDIIYDEEYLSFNVRELVDNDNIDGMATITYHECAVHTTGFDEESEGL